jgi:hypothetical protein
MSGSHSLSLRRAGDFTFMLNARLNRGAARGPLRDCRLSPGQGDAGQFEFQFPRFLQAMTLVLAGNMKEARQVVRGALELQPGFQTRLAFEIGLLQEFSEKLAERARLVGLPE